MMKKYPLATIGGLGLVAAISLLLNINTRPGTRWPSFTTQGGGR
jgi:hypothetical protein